MTEAKRLAANISNPKMIVRTKFNTWRETYVWFSAIKDTFELIALIMPELTHLMLDLEHSFRAAASKGFLSRAFRHEEKR